MKSFNIHFAKTHLSQLIEKAADGEPFVIAKAGKPMVKVIPIGSGDLSSKSRFGFMKGQAKVPSQEAFDDLGAKEIEAMFGGEE